MKAKATLWDHRLECNLSNHRKHQFAIAKQRVFQLAKKEYLYIRRQEMSEHPAHLSKELS